MRKRMALAAVVAAIVAPAAWAGDVLILRDYRPHCCSRVTEICRVPAATPFGIPRLLGDNTGHPVGTPAVLQCRDWQGGRNFTDQNGRRWQLASPLPMRTTPAELRGVMYRGPDGTSLFMTADRLAFVELQQP